MLNIDKKLIIMLIFTVLIASLSSVSAEKLSLQLIEKSTNTQITGNTVYPDYNIQAVVTLTDDNGNPIRGRDITFLVNDFVISGSALTNERGIAIHPQGFTRLPFLEKNDILIMALSPDPTNVPLQDSKRLTVVERSINNDAIYSNNNDDSANSSINPVAKSNITPVKPKIPSFSLTTGNKKITIKWNKVSGVSGYEIYKSTKKNGKYVLKKAITKGNTVQFTDKNLKKKQKYYYKIRSYVKKDGKKVYSKFSSIKSKTTK
jgi:hypothetical protein